MGKVIATYLARITLREPDDLAEGEEVEAAPTLERVNEAVQGAVLADLVVSGTGPEGVRMPDVNVSSERVDA